MAKQAMPDVWCIKKIELPSELTITLDDAQVKSILASYVQDTIGKQVTKIEISYDCGRYCEGDGTDEASAVVSIKM